FLLAPEDLRSTIAAFLESFPEGSAWIGYMEPRRFVLGLVGGSVASPLPLPVRGRYALGPSELRVLAAGESPIRDADPKLEIRSNRRADEGAFGRENLSRVLGSMRSSAVLPGAETAREGWRRLAEAGLAAMEDGEGSDRALLLYREAVRASPDVEDAAFM